MLHLETTVRAYRYALMYENTMLFLFDSDDDAHELAAVGPGEQIKYKVTLEQSSKKRGAFEIGDTSRKHTNIWRDGKIVGNVETIFLLAVVGAEPLARADGERRFDIVVKENR